MPNWNTGPVARLWLEGKSAAQIMREVGAPSRSAVIAYVHRNGITRPEAARPARPAKAQPGAAPYPRGRAIAPKPPVMAPVLKADAAPLERASAPELKTLWERGPRECCWPVGAPDRERGQLYCARPVEPRRSYCADHRTSVAGSARPARPVGEAGVRRRQAADEVGSEDLMDLVELVR